MGDYSLFGIDLINADFWRMIVKFLFNLAVITVIIRVIYYPTTKRKDYLFTYFLIGLITFCICVILKKTDLDTGLGLGLFAIFGIIKYRTDAIPIKEMTYLFVVIGISVINALVSSKQTTWVEIGFINCIIILIVFALEKVFLLKHESSKIILYEKIDLIRPEKHNELLIDLEQRTGLKINRVAIGKVNFLRDTAQVIIFYYESDQNISDYSSKDSGDDD